MMYRLGDGKLGQMVGVPITTPGHLLVAVGSSSIEKERYPSAFQALCN